MSPIEIIFLSVMLSLVAITIVIDLSYRLIKFIKLRRYTIID